MGFLVYVSKAQGIRSLPLFSQKKKKREKRKKRSPFPLVTSSCKQTKWRRNRTPLFCILTAATFSKFLTTRNLISISISLGFVFPQQGGWIKHRSRYPRLATTTVSFRSSLVIYCLCCLYFFFSFWGMGDDGLNLQFLTVIFRWSAGSNRDGESVV